MSVRFPVRSSSSIDSNGIGTAKRGEKERGQVSGTTGKERSGGTGVGERKDETGQGRAMLSAKIWIRDA